MNLSSFARRTASITLVFAAVAGYACGDSSSDHPKGNPIGTGGAGATTVATSTDSSTHASSSPAVSSATQASSSTGAGGGPCMNGVKDGSETDVDCGGGTCPTCIDGKKCNQDPDCTEKNCVAGVCAIPTCA